MGPLQPGLNEGRAVYKVKVQIDAQRDKRLQFVAPRAHGTHPRGCCVGVVVAKLLRIEFYSDVQITLGTDVTSDSTAKEVHPLNERPGQRPLVNNLNKI